MDDQDPNLWSFISKDQIRQRMQIIASVSQWIRSFGSTHGLKHTKKTREVLIVKSGLQIASAIKNSYYHPSSAYKPFLSAARWRQPDLPVADILKMSVLAAAVFFRSWLYFAPNLLWRMLPVTRNPALQVLRWHCGRPGQELSAKSKN